MQKTPKILVEIIGGPFPKKCKCRVEGNRVILREAKEGRGGAAITAEYDSTCFVPYYAGFPFPPFKHIKHKLILKEGSTHCISYANPENYIAPPVTILDVFNYFKASVLSAAARFKPESKILTYLLLGIVIIIGVLNLLVSSGNIHF